MVAGGSVQRAWDEYLALKDAWAHLPDAELVRRVEALTAGLVNASPPEGGIMLEAVGAAEALSRGRVLYNLSHLCMPNLPESASRCASAVMTALAWPRPSNVSGLPFPGVPLPGEHMWFQGVHAAPRPLAVALFHGPARPVCDPRADVSADHAVLQAQVSSLCPNGAPLLLPDSVHLHDALRRCLRVDLTGLAAARYVEALTAVQNPALLVNVRAAVSTVLVPWARHGALAPSARAAATERSWFRLQGAMVSFPDLLRVHGAHSLVPIGVAALEMAGHSLQLLWQDTPARVWQAALALAAEHAKAAINSLKQLSAESPSTSTCTASGAVQDSRQHLETAPVPSAPLPARFACFMAPDDGNTSLYTTFYPRGVAFPVTHSSPQVMRLAMPLAATYASLGLMMEAVAVATEALTKCPQMPITDADSPMPGSMPEHFQLLPGFPPEAQAIIAPILLFSGKTQAASVALKQAMVCAEVRSQCLILHALCALGAMCLDSAVGHLEQCVGTGHPDLYHFLTDSEFKVLGTGQPTQQQACWTPDTQDALCIMAALHTQRGCPELASRALKCLVECTLRNPSVYYHILHSVLDTPEPTNGTTADFHLMRLHRLHITLFTEGPRDGPRAIPPAGTDLLMHHSAAAFWYARQLQLCGLPPSTDTTKRLATLTLGSLVDLAKKMGLASSARRLAYVYPLPGCAAHSALEAGAMPGLWSEAPLLDLGTLSLPGALSDGTSSGRCTNLCSPVGPALWSSLIDAATPGGAVALRHPLLAQMAWHARISSSPTYAALKLQPATTYGQDPNTDLPLQHHQMLGKGIEVRTELQSGLADELRLRTVPWIGIGDHPMQLFVFLYDWPAGYHICAFDHRSHLLEHRKDELLCPSGTPSVPPKSNPDSPCFGRCFAADAFGAKDEIIALLKTAPHISVCSVTRAADGSSLHVQRLGPSDEESLAVSGDATGLSGVIDTVNQLAAQVLFALNADSTSNDSVLSEAKSRRYTKHTGKDLSQGCLRDAASAVFEAQAIRADDDYDGGGDDDTNFLKRPKYDQSRIGLPWESLPLLASERITRAPSLRWLTDRLRLLRPDAPTNVSRDGVRSTKVAALVDPDGNLGKSAGRLRPVLHDEW
eukprot:gene5077-911_t